MGDMGVMVSVTGASILTTESNLKKLNKELDVFKIEQEDAIKVAKEFGIDVDKNNEVVEDSTTTTNTNTNSIDANTTAKRDNALATDFLSTVSQDYFNSLTEDVLNGTATIEQQEQKLRDFQIELLDNLLKDEELTYEERVKLETKLNKLKLDNMKTEQDSRQKDIDGVAALGQQLITLAGEDEKCRKLEKLVFNFLLLLLLLIIY